MQIVIDIPNDIYNDIMAHNRESREGAKSAYYFEGLIQNSTPLPKGHGRLGDLSKVYDKLNEAQVEGTEEYKGLGEAKQIVCNTSTVIEVHKESEVKNE